MTLTSQGSHHIHKGVRKNNEPVSKVLKCIYWRFFVCRPNYLYVMRTDVIFFLLLMQFPQDFVLIGIFSYLKKKCPFVTETYFLENA